MASSVWRVRFSSSPPITKVRIVRQSGFDGVGGRLEPRRHSNNLWAYGGRIPHSIGEGSASLGNIPLDVKTGESGDTGSNPERPPIS